MLKYRIYLDSMERVREFVKVASMFHETISIFNGGIDYEIG
jgi:hypothetical protein